MTVMLPVQPKPDNAATTDRDEAVADALDLLAEGRFEDVPASTGGLLGRVRDIGVGLQGRFRDNLRHMVAMSIKLNEAVVVSAAMIRDTREVDQGTQSMAAATEELVASVREISTNTRDAAEQATAARATSDRVTRASEQAVASMEQISSAVGDAAAKVEVLSEASDQIGEIIGQIDVIAKQTNLLALNATIEAARAGDAGKGFAVVASEVKNLSNQTSQATDDIRQRIETLQKEMREIVESMQQGADAVEAGRTTIAEAGEAMRELSGQVVTISDKMDDVAGILDQQTEASNEVSSGIAKIAGMTADNVGQIESIVDHLAGVDEELTATLDETMTQQIPDMTIYRAKSDHVIWKKKLAEMVVGRARLEPDELADHHTCRLGKWYDAIEDAEITQHPAYKSLAEPHRAVHAHGIEAARKYNAGDLAGATEEIAAVERYSVDVLRCLDELLDR